MTTFALIHGAGDGGWYWHLVEAELRARGHRTVAPDLPTDPSATLDDFAGVVLDAVGEVDGLVVVTQSFGAFTGPLVAARRPTEQLVIVTGMVPTPGERPDDWWSATGYAEDLDDDLRVVYYHDVPDHLVDEALARERAHPTEAAGRQPWPLTSWPDVPTRFVLCTEDRLFSPAFMRRVVRDRLGVVPEELASGHCAALAHPRELAALIDAEA